MQPTRREFMKGAAAVASGAMLSRRAMALSPNDRIGIAVIGCGDRGSYLVNLLMSERENWNIEVPAVCDVWKVNLERMAERVHSDAGRRPKTLTRHQDVLALPEVDAVIVATPDLHHSPIAAEAARAGKHIFVEKPLANRMEDANAALDAVLESGVICQVGTQRRSDPRHRRAAKLLHTGVLGRLVVCEVGWNRNVASWVRDYGDVRREDVDWEQFLAYLPPEPFDPRKFRCWHLYRDCALGLVNLLGSHVIDVVQWFANDPMPASAVGVEAHVVWTERDNADTQEITYQYPSGFLLRHFSRLGNAHQPYEALMTGTNGVFDTATWELRGDGAVEGPDKIAYRATVRADSSPGGRGWEWRHVKNWIDCMREDRRDTNADIRVGYAQAVAGIMGYLACREGRKMVWREESRTVEEA
jgi:predicted dehydrogenase